MMSRVVPACGETIATSRRASWFISVDLPTFGGPAIATTSPSRRRSLWPCAARTSSISASSASDLRKRRRDQFRRHIALVGKIDAGLDQRRSLDDLRAPVARAVAEQALQLAQRLAALPVGVGMDQIVETFGLGEVELAVLERAAGKFAGLGRPHIFASPTAPRTAPPAPRVRHGREIRRHPRRSRWPAPETRAPPRRRSAVGRIAQQRPRRHPGRRNFAGQRGQRRAGLGPETRTMAIALGGRPDDRAKIVCSRGCIAYLCGSP